MTAVEGQDKSAVILRNQEGQVARLEDSAAGETPAFYEFPGVLMQRILTVQFLHSRTYRGLDPRIGQDAPGVLEQGRSGVARGYEDDRTLGS